MDTGDTDPGAARKPTVTIVYCRQCQWLLRAGWMAQEILQTFAEEVGAVVLVPATGGAFRIAVDGVDVWERTRDGGFPDPRTLKQRVRERVAPERDLGHLDRTGSARASIQPDGAAPAGAADDPQQA